MLTMEPKKMDEIEDGYYWVWSDDGLEPEMARKAGRHWWFMGWDQPYEDGKNFRRDYPHREAVPLPSTYNKGTAPMGGVSDIKGYDPLDPQPQLCDKQGPADEG